MFDHRSARDFLQKALAKHPFYGPTGVIWAEAEEKGRTGVVSLQDVQQAGNALASAAPSIDINFEGEALFGHLINQILGFGDLATVIVKNSLERIGHAHHHKALSGFSWIRDWI